MQISAACPLRPAPAPLDCSECGGSSPVSHEWCDHCSSLGREPCFYRFDGCRGSATHTVDGYGCCGACDLSEVPEVLCACGDPVVVNGACLDCANVAYLASLDLRGVAGKGAA